MFAAVPTTLGVGEALVRASGGNAALALLLLVGTNALGVATVPPLVKLLMSGADGFLDASVDAVDLLVKLVCTVLVPAILGKVGGGGRCGCGPWLAGPSLWFVLGVGCRGSREARSRADGLRAAAGCRPSGACQSCMRAESAQPSPPPHPPPTLHANPTPPATHALHLPMRLRRRRASCSRPCARL